MVDGFLVDRGFQVHNTAYPEARRVLDHAALDLRAFSPGALVRLGDRLHRLADPRRRPLAAASTVAAPIGSPLDKARIALLAARDALLPTDRLIGGRETTTYRALRDRGLSDEVIDRFLRPFLAGVFLEDELSTSSVFFDLVWRTFVRGTVCVPAGGMRQIPRQLAGALPAGTVHTGLRADHARAGEVGTAGGAVRARAVLVATDPTTAARLLPDLTAPSMNSVTTIYHVVPEPPVTEGDPPSGRRAVRSDRQLRGADERRADLLTRRSGIGLHLRPRHRPTARRRAPRSTRAPLRTVGRPTGNTSRPSGCRRRCRARTRRWGSLRKPVDLGGGVFVAGDHRDTPSIQGALVSGKRAAAAVLRSLSTKGGGMNLLATSGGFKAGRRTRLVPGPLIEHAFRLAGSPARPRFCYVGTAGGDNPLYVAAVYEAFVGRDVAVSHLSAFPMPTVEDVRGHLLAQDVVWVGGGSVRRSARHVAAPRLGRHLPRGSGKRASCSAACRRARCAGTSAGTTDSFGTILRPVTNGLGFIPHSNGVHYDSEEQRRPLYHRLVSEGVLPAGYATDDGVGLHYRGTELVEAVSDTAGKAAYWVERGPEGTAVETKIEPTMLGEG